MDDDGDGSGMMSMLAAMAASSSGLSISPVATAIDNSTGGGTCYATIAYNSDGIEYENSSAAAITADQSRGNWLDSGLNSQVWVERTIDVGTLDTDAGTGRLVLSTTRTFGIENAAIKAATVTFKFYDAATGGSEIASVQIQLDVDGT